MDKSFQKMLEIFAQSEIHKKSCEYCEPWISSNRCLSEEYMRKYWLSEDEWQNYWLPLLNSIFCYEDTRLPDFHEELILMASPGGVPFGEFDFHALQNCMKEVGEKEFVMIENYGVPWDTSGRALPQLRCKFPVDIAWNEFNPRRMGSIQAPRCAEVTYFLHLGMYEFFIFGDSGLWGKYAACEYHDISINFTGTPLDITGFKAELTPIFKKHFDFDTHFCYYGSISEHWTEEDIEEHRELLPKWLPANYKKRMELQK